MRVAVLTSLPWPVVLRGNSLPLYLRQAGIPVSAIIAQRIPLHQALRSQVAEKGAGVLRDIIHDLRLRIIRRSSQSSVLSTRIPIHYVRNHNSPQCEALLRTLEVDLLILGRTEIMRKHILELPTIGAIGCHYGLLPKFRGMNVVEWAVFYDEPVGISVFYVDHGVDTGDIILRRQIPVSPGETLHTLRRKCSDGCKALLVEAVRIIREGSGSRIPQRPGDGRQYFRMHPRLIRLAEQKLVTEAYLSICAGHERSSEIHGA